MKLLPRRPAGAFLRRAALCVAGIVAATLLVPATARADNPIVQTIYTADPAPLVHNGRVYLYTGHDEDASTYFTMKDWRVFSSAARAMPEPVRRMQATASICAKPSIRGVTMANS